MSGFEICLFLLTILAVLVGSWAIFWARSVTDATRRFWGRCLFVATLCLLGIGGLIAAWHKADGLVPLGLSAGFLVIGMVWESPLEGAKPQVIVPRWSTKKSAC
jgi:hypothetical protein